MTIKICFLLCLLSLGFIIFPRLMTASGQEITNPLILYPREELKSPPITETQLKKYIATEKDYFAKFSELEPQFIEEVNKLPHAGHFLDIMQEKGNPTANTIPIGIREFYRKYFGKGEPFTTGHVSDTLDTMIMAEVSQELLYVPKSMIPILNKLGWSDPKEFARVQYQTLLNWRIVDGITSMDKLEAEMNSETNFKKDRKVLPKVLRPSASAEKLSPSILDACRTALGSYLQPEVAPFIKKYENEINKSLYFPTSETQQLKNSTR